MANLSDINVLYTVYILPSVYVHRYTYRVHTHTVEEHAHIYCHDRTLVQFLIGAVGCGEGGGRGGGCQKIGLCIVLERERNGTHYTTVGL